MMDLESVCEELEKVYEGSEPLECVEITNDEGVYSFSYEEVSKDEYDNKIVIFRVDFESENENCKEIGYIKQTESDDLYPVVKKEKKVTYWEEI